MKKINLNKHRTKESGNVLFLILIAVALFAALSYAVTQSTRSGSNDANREKTLVSTSQITQYPSGVRTSVLRMILNGIAPEDLYFDPPSFFTSGGCTATANTICDNPADTDKDDELRAVFHPKGGGAPYQLAQPEYMAAGVQGQWVFSDGWQVDRIGTTGTAATNADLIAFLPGLKAGMCRRINEEYGITYNATTDPDSDLVPQAVASPGVIPNIVTNAHNMRKSQAPGFSTANPVLIGDGATALTAAFSGQPYGCGDFNTSNTDAANFVYYHVMLER